MRRGDYIKIVNSIDKTLNGDVGIILSKDKHELYEVCVTSRNSNEYTFYYWELQTIEKEEYELLLHLRGL